MSTYCTTILGYRKGDRTRLDYAEPEREYATDADAIAGVGALASAEGFEEVIDHEITRRDVYDPPQERTVYPADGGLPLCIRTIAAWVPVRGWLKPDTSEDALMALVARRAALVGEPVDTEATNGPG